MPQQNPYSEPTNGVRLIAHLPTQRRSIRPPALAVILAQAQGRPVDRLVESLESASASTDAFTAILDRLAEVGPQVAAQLNEPPQRLADNGDALVLDGEET